MFFGASYPWRHVAYKTYTEQVQEHIKALNENGLNISDLKLDSSRWVRCHGHEETKGRGEYSYISSTEQLDNGLLGIRTSFRGQNGLGNIKTYGLHPSENENVSFSAHHMVHEAPKEEQEAAARWAYGFWSHSNIQGSSNYLDRKGVGSYGIRFRSSEEYGNVAVVPMFDEHERLWSYQLLNPDGTKRHPKGCRTDGLFHRLGHLLNGERIGIAESYVTAATCMELSGVPTICAFTSENLFAVSQSIRILFPKSHIILFADNDQHLEKTRNRNAGILKAIQSRDAIGCDFTLAAPGFNEIESSKEASDWNDLVRLKNKDEALSQMAKFL
ncbi:MAG: hypothetical protein EBZ47_07040 [Chlamydiae bacterium]|nr:hypothetical protein [Chlamydiota bacterium]